MSFDMPSYIIYRDIPAGQPFDVMAPLAFFPPKDSDELFDALRTKYPHLRTHQERTRQAVIEYLMHEDPVSASLDQLPTPQTAPSVNCSPWEASMQSMSSESSTWSSPELFDLATPLFGNSPQPQSQTLPRQPSTTAAPSITESTPPALEQMTGVFSLSDHSQPKQRVRRKMTEAEKAEYRKRRIARACDKCAKRKRKCNHNQPETEHLASQMHKIAKSTAVSQSKPTVLKQQKPQQQHQNISFSSDSTFFDQSLLSDAPMPSFEDFTMLSEDLLYTGDDTQVPFDYWQETPLFDPTIDGSQYPYNQQASNAHNPIAGSSDRHSQALWSNQPSGDFELPQETQQPTHTRHLHESYGGGDNELPRLNEPTGADLHAQWQQRSLVQEDQNRSSPNIEQQSSQRNATTHGGSGRYPSLPEMILRLTGTKKAVAAFGKLLPNSSPKKSTLQTVSLRKVAIIALGSLSPVQASLRHPARPPQLNPTVGHRGSDQYQSSGSCELHISRASNLHRHILSHEHVAPDRWDDLLDNQLSTGSGNSWSLSSSTSLLQANRRDIPQHNSRGSSGDDGDIPIPVPLPSPKYHQVKTYPRSLGEGISTMKSPNTELYLLKRGISTGGLATLRRTVTNSFNEPVSVNATASAQPLRTQGIGGAYPRLERSAAHDVPASTGATASVANAVFAPRSTDAAAPVHTRPHTATMSGFVEVQTRLSRFSWSGPSASGRWSKNGQGSEVAHNAIAAPSAHAASEGPTSSSSSAGPSTVLSSFDWSGSNASGHWHMNDQGVEEVPVALGSGTTSVDFAYITPTHNEVVNYRLSDHFRCRDHFGRLVLPSGMGLLATLVALGSLLFALASLVSVDTSSIATSSLSFVLLALLQPVSVGDHFDISGETSGVEDHRTDVNERLFGSLQKCIGMFLGRGVKIGGRGRVNSIGKKAI